MNPKMRRCNIFDSPMAKNHEEIQVQLDIIKDSILKAEEALVSIKRLIGLIPPIEGLTNREREVFKLTRDGLSAKECGKLMFVSEHAVFFHRKNIRKKLGIKGKRDLPTCLP